MGSLLDIEIILHGIGSYTPVNNVYLDAILIQKHRKVDKKAMIS